MDRDDLLLRLGMALAIGFLIGLERGWKDRTEKEGQRTAGLRTFTLIALLGGIFGALTKDQNFLLLASGFVVVSGALAAFFWREGVSEDDFSATSLVAVMLTFMLGAFAVLGDTVVAAAAGVAAAVLLAAKVQLHGWLARITWPELRAGLLLLAMTFIALPLLPHRAVDPYGAVNPYELWLMTILIAAVSFAGYAAIRIAGPERGTVLAAGVGGLVASTATTLTLARLARDNPERVRLLGGSVVLSGAVMLIRVLVVVAIINLGFAKSLAPALIAGAVAMAVFAFWLIRSGPSGDKATRADLKLKNPFELIEVLRFGALLTVIMMLAVAARYFFGEAGLIGLAAISGLADVDAITLSMAKTAGSDTTAGPGLAILTAVGVNTIAKTGYAAYVGGNRIGLIVAAGTVLGFAAAAAAYLLVPAAPV
ncbi:MgtC/SapB family protein [Taklimakanibacter deserti]|uniref:MgtC/SapB family protein n=1 Tax=Taklimakanibacter deserti TaxID=2267839 RepID=UPI000E65744B